MVRFDGQFKAASGGRITVPDLLGPIDDAGFSERPRRAAIACYLSASDGWRAAGQQLSGAFADGPQAQDSADED